MKEATSDSGKKKFRGPSALDVVSKALGRASHAYSGKTGQIEHKEYEPGSMNMGFNVVEDPVEFERLRTLFLTTRDRDGRTMQEACDEYWKEKFGKLKNL